MSKRVVLAPDIQAPYQNPRQVNALGAFVNGLRPDDSWACGDLWDLPMVSRWERNRRGEFSGKIQEHIDDGRRVIEKLKITHLKVGNHDRRVEQYVENYAPALSPLAGLKMEKLFGLEDLGCVLHRELWEFTPGWVLAHGDEGSISKVGGMTALNLAKSINKSVICGHTHRQGHVVQGSSLLGVEGDSIHGVELGHCMRLADAGYLKSGIANWQAGFAVADISNKRVAIQLIQMSPTGSFFFEGQSYEDGKLRRGSTK